LAIDLSAVKNGEKINGNFLVLQKERKLTKAGKPYCDLLLGYKKGAIAAKIWDLDDDIFAAFEKESVVEVSGTLDTFNNKPQIRVQGIKVIDESAVNYEDFLPSTDEDVEKLREELFTLIDSIQDTHIKRLLNYIFNDSEIIEAFLKAPAAKNFHHAYIGGLLEHTVGVAGLCDTIAKNYTGLVNRDLLVAGALLHDIGKVREFSYLRTIDYSTEGRLIGHHVLGYEIIRQAAMEAGDISDEVALQLTHLILSHHGTYENQSPRKPKTIEALLLHLCDDADAKINAFKHIGEDADEDAEWSPYNRVLDRFVYLKKLDDPCSEEPPITAELDTP